MIAGDCLGAAGTILLACYGRGDADKPPLIHAVSSETGISGVTIYYPEQKPDAVVPYAATIGGEIKTIRNVTLCNSYRGIEPRMFNGVSFANIRGTVLASGIRGVESTEFSWMHDVAFTPDVWIGSAQSLTGKAMTPAEKAALTAYVAGNCTGLELGRIDGLAITRFSAEGAMTPVLIKRNPKYDDPVHGFGGVVSGFPAFRSEVANGPWYYGVDMMLVNACYGIDLASAQCDNHLVRGLWGTTFFNGIAVGGGSKNGRLEQICFSFGPWLEAGAPNQ